MTYICLKGGVGLDARDNTYQYAVNCTSFAETQVLSQGSSYTSEHDNPSCRPPGVGAISFTVRIIIYRMTPRKKCGLFFLFFH